ncbi:hypothetical protein ACEPAG_2660 [Sanghuangporus baumii]
MRLYISSSQIWDSLRVPWRRNSPPTRAPQRIVYRTSAYPRLRSHLDRWPASFLRRLGAHGDGLGVFSLIPLFIPFFPRSTADTDRPGSGVVTTEQVQVRTVANEKGTTVNADMERDVNGYCVSAKSRDAETNEVLKSEISKESEPSHTRPHHPTVPGSGTTRRRGKKTTRVTKPRRITQATERKGGSNRGTSTAHVSGKILPDHGPSKMGVNNAKNKRGTSENTNMVATGRKRGREQMSDADLQTGDVASKRTKTWRIHRNIRRSTPVGEAPSVARNLRDSTNANPGVEETKDVLILPATQHGAEQRLDELPILDSVSDPAAVCSRQSQKEKENSSAARLTSSPVQHSRRKGTCSDIVFVLALDMLELSKPRIFARLQNNSGPGGERKQSGCDLSRRNPQLSSLRVPRESRTESVRRAERRCNTASLLSDLPVEAARASTWEVPRLDPDDFAFLVRRATPYRFEESYVRNEALTRPTPEE